MGDHLTLFLTLSLTLNLTLTLTLTLLLTLSLTLNLTLNVTVIGLGGLPRFCQIALPFPLLTLPFFPSFALSYTLPFHPHLPFPSPPDTVLHIFPPTSGH